MGDRLEKAYLEARLSLSIPSVSSRFVADLVTEAGSFVGHDPHRRVFHSIQGPFQAVEHFFTSVTLSVEVVSGIGLVWKATTSVAGSTFSFAKTILLALALAPTATTMIALWAQQVQRELSRDRREAQNRVRAERSKWEEIGLNSANRQETVLFGITDWIMAGWDASVQEERKLNTARRTLSRTIDLGIEMCNMGIDSLFDVCLASRNAAK